MKLQWKVKSPAFYLEEMKKFRVNSDGDSLNGDVDFYVWSKVLKYMINFPPNIKENDIHLSIKNSLIKSLKQGDFSENGFLEKLESEIKKRGGKKISRKVLEAEISVSVEEDVELEFFGSLIKIIHDKYSVYSKIELETDSYNTEASYFVSILNLFRSIICFFENHGMSLDFKEDVIKPPINRVSLKGPFKLYNQDGTIIDETNFIMHPNDRRLLIKSQTWLKIEEFVKAINNSSFKEEIRDTLLLYVHALDEQDHNVAFILLWNCLDNLTNSVKGKYELIIKRVSSIYPNYKYHETILEYLRNYRNEFAHRGKKIPDATISCYLLQEYLRDIVHLYIENIEIFTNPEQLKTFLDFISDKKALKNNFSMHELFARANLRWKNYF
ncbi:TPA: hypothetical protein ACM2VO_003199 [Legionella pneumophila]